MTRPWQAEVGDRPFRVTVYEHPERELTLYLRWRPGRGKAVKLRSLGYKLRSREGKIIREREREARAAAQRQYEQLAAGTLGEADTPAAPLTIAEAFDRVSDPGKGRYATRTPYRNEVMAALAFASALWGGDRAWNTIRRADLRELGRARVRALVAAGRQGYRGAEITVQRVLTVAQLLRDDEMIDEAACVASAKWKEELRTFWKEHTGTKRAPTVHRPRHTSEQSNLIRVAAWDVDPRLGLLLALGAELRSGQVRRARRRDLDLAHGRFTVPAHGKKGGAVVFLTAGQIADAERALKGYLSALEAAYQAGELADYPLFPNGQMPGGRKGTPVATLERHATAGLLSRRAMEMWFREAERIAGVPPVRGRVFYGLRRAAVDAAKSKKISREGLQQSGGWSDSQIPDSIYADSEADYAREEAREVRAKIRGEA